MLLPTASTKGGKKKSTEDVEMVNWKDTVRIGQLSGLSLLCLVTHAFTRYFSTYLFVFSGIFVHIHHIHP